MNKIILFEFIYNSKTEHMKTLKKVKTRHETMLFLNILLHLTHLISLVSETKNHITSKYSPLKL